MADLTDKTLGMRWRTYVGWRKVSTVYLGRPDLDYMFETIVFAGKGRRVPTRIEPYETFMDARMGHYRIVEAVRRNPKAYYVWNVWPR